MNWLIRKRRRKNRHTHTHTVPSSFNRNWKTREKKMARRLKAERKEFINIIFLYSFTQPTYRDRWMSWQRKPYTFKWIRIRMNIKTPYTLGPERTISYEWMSEWVSVFSFGVDENCCKVMANWFVKEERKIRRCDFRKIKSVVKIQEVVQQFFTPNNNKKKKKIIFLGPCLMGNFVKYLWCSCWVLKKKLRIFITPYKCGTQTIRLRILYDNMNNNIWNNLTVLPFFFLCEFLTFY